MPTVSPSTKRLFLFLFLNFSALGIGGLLMGGGPTSEWYQGLNRAPWTPPGWVFGASWTAIMLCFSVYMMVAYDRVPHRRQLLVIYGLQWILNVSWNPIFFAQQAVWLGLVVILALMVGVAFFLFGYRHYMARQSLWVAPYFIWLVIATSLNAYVCFNN